MHCLYLAMWNPDHLRSGLIARKMLELDPVDESRALGAGERKIMWSEDGEDTEQNALPCSKLLEESLKKRVGLRIFEEIRDFLFHALSPTKEAVIIPSANFQKLMRGGSRQAGHAYVHIKRCEWFQRWCSHNEEGLSDRV